MKARAVRIIVFLLMWLVLAVIIRQFSAIEGGLAAFLRPLVGALRGGPYSLAVAESATASRIELLRLREAERRLEELERMLGLPRSSAWHVEVAPIVARDPLAWDLTFRIGKGAAHGIREGAAVIARGVVVGRVASVSRQSAIVDTVLSPACQIGVKLGDSGGVGILKGGAGGRTLCLIDYLDRDFDYRVGEEVATSGLSEVIPGGLPIGRIVPWQKDKIVHIVNSSYAQLQMRATVAGEDFRHVWVVSRPPAGEMPR